MTVLQLSVQQLHAKGFSHAGALATTAWVILTSKFANDEEVTLDQSFSKQVSKGVNKCVLSVTRESVVHGIISKVDNAAYDGGRCHLWQLCLQLALGHRSGASSGFISLLIIEGRESKSNWQELVAEINSSAHLVMMVNPRADGVNISLSPSQLSGSAISSIRMQRLFRQFTHVIEQLKHTMPTTTVGDLGLVCPSDFNDMQRWNSNPPSPVDECVHWAIQRQSHDNPASPALCAWDGNLSYQELTSLSNRLCRRLMSLGVGPEVLVPICFEKSVWVIVAMMAVLKAGGACVPLNPAHPRSRQLAILTDVQASLVICSESLYSLCSGLNQVLVVVSSTAVESLPKDDSDPDPCSVRVSPDNTVFAVFTSGSTGQPKGIIIEHRAMSTSVRDHGQLMRFGKETRTIQFAAFTFDDSFSDIFTTLIYGGCICLPSDHDRLNDLAGSINRMQANHACLTTTVASQLRPSDVPTLKTLVVGGESVTSRVLQQWANHVYLINSYGPAEASIFCSGHAGLSPDDDATNIGVGVGCLLHITDPLDHNALLPVGAVGELLIEGPILARCYIRNETKTQASFITDPAWASGMCGDPGSTRRFYKTGDLARFDEDGTIQVLGRKDTQIKLYGQRIELGEIEHHIRNEVKGCKDVAVEVIHPKPSLGTRDSAPMLVAFLQLLGEGESLDNSSTHSLAVEIMQGPPYAAGQRLRQVLPSYMIPSAFLRVEKMPLMVSGKLDRKQLREMGERLTVEALMGSVGDEVAATYRDPQSPKEKTLQVLWAEVLGVESTLIKIESNFFHLGGDSVGAMKLVTAARNDGIKLTVQEIFQKPCLGAQSEVLEVLDDAVPKSGYVEPFHLLDGEEKTLEQALKLLGNNDLEVEQGQDVILDMYPCSPLQSGLVALSTRNPGSYVAQMAYELPLRFEISRFKQAWESVFESNAILRTRIIQSREGSKLWQVVVREQICWLEIHQDLESYLALDKQTQMSLGSKLTRFTMVHSDTTRWFVWTIHHAIFDEESLRVLLRSVEQEYHGLSVEPGLEFNVFIQYLSASETSVTEEFWKKQLESPPPPSFPTLPKPDHLPMADQSLGWTVECETNRASEITLSNLLRATWAVLLSQYSESSDVIFGCTVNGRSVALDKATRTSGPTFATVPIRVLVDQEYSVPEFLRLLQQQYVDMIPHEQAGLQNIARWAPEAHTACKFQSLLVVQAATGPEDARSNMLLEVPELLGVSAGFLPHVLTIECRPVTGGIALQFHYDSKVIEKAQVERLVRQFGHVFHQLYTHERSPETRIKSLDILCSQDREELHKWNTPTSSDRVDELMHQGFYPRILENPCGIAAEDSHGSITYSELDRLSNRVARFLVSELGVQVGQFVPLCMEKSIYIIVSVLAILKAGGVLMLLDPSLPVARLSYLVTKTDAAFVLCSDETTHLGLKISQKAVNVGQNKTENLTTSDAHFQVEVDPNTPGCIVFTSGSTGNPKGTIISHRAWSSGARKHAIFCGMDRVQPVRVLQFASISFDMAIQEMLTTLSLGGCICIPSETERTSEGIVAAINRMKVTWLFLTPAFASLIDSSSVPTLRTLAFGGEAVNPSLFTHFPPHVQLLQCYGPSECTPVSFISPHLDEKIPGNIGRAIIGSSWIVDPANHHRLVPIGAVGELLLAGPHVGDGYLGESAKTAQVFVQQPQWMRDYEYIPVGERLYLTGDLVRYNTDGTVIFTGRKDTQIKLRGQRMELTETEHHLQLLIPQVKGIVVEVVTPSGQDGQILVAFLPISQGSLGAEEEDILLPPSILSTIENVHVPTVVAQATSILPRYMVPNIFLPIRRVPFLRSSSKVDHRRLRAIASNLAPSQLRQYTIRHHTREIPRTPREVKLRELFVKVLGMEEQSIAIHDDFLLLGGNSIDAMRLVALAKVSGLTLTVSQIFKSPILSELAQVAVEKEENDIDFHTIATWALLKDRQAADAIRTEAERQCQLASGSEIEDAYPCTPLQEGMFAASLAQPGTYFAQHVFVVSPLVAVERLKIAWQRLFASLSIFRTRIIQLPSSEVMQIIIKEPFAWITKVNLAQYLQQDRRIEFGLGSQLNRFALIQPADASSTFVVWSAHHSIYDGFSIPLVTAALEGALQESWDGSTLGQRADFRPYVKYVRNSDPEKCREYWKQQFVNGQFDGFPAVNSQKTGHVDREFISESIPYAQTLPATVTPASIIRSAWAMTIHSYTGSPDVVFGATVSGRDAPVSNVSDIIGPVLSTVPVRAIINRSQTVREFVEQVQQQTVQMIDFQHFGLQNIRSSSPEAEAACQFQNLLVIQPSSMAAPGDLIRHQFEDGNDDENVQTHTYPMVVSCDITGTSIEIKALFDSEVINMAQMQRILELFGQFIEQIAQAAPESTLSQLKRINSKDIETLHAWNANTAMEITGCIHQMLPFQTHAKQLAITSWDGELTYEELDILSTKIAHHLVLLGAGPEQFVPLCFRKSLWALVSVISVLKAGGAPVFLNPDFVPDRISNLVDFLDARILLVGASMITQEGMPAVKTIVEIDQTLVNGLSIPTNSGLPEVKPNNMAFGSFTSGTTGVPKCIILEHRNICTLMDMFSKVGEFPPGSRVLQFASYTFDATIKDFLATLLHGGTIYMPSDEDRMNNLLEYMRSQKITQATLTPTIGSLLTPTEVPSLKVLVLAGEKLSKQNIATWAPFAHLNNGYGPSETTGRATCNSGLNVDTDPSNIGFPFGGACWVVEPDDHHALVPIGAVGELVVQGPTVSRGYFKNPEKTADAFISPPAWLKSYIQANQHRRLYKTGDLVRYNTDGSLTFLGRKDTQVKLHGQRIELEEIEFQFKSHLPPQVGIVVEMVSPKGDGGNILLVAFLHDKSVEQSTFEVQFIASHGTSLAEVDIHKVSSAVAQTLPPYMMPTMFLGINRVPLLPSAKTNRRSLKTLFANYTLDNLAGFSVVSARGMRVPTTQRQKQLRTIIAAVLRIDEGRISLDHSFLRLGGDSFTAIRLVSAARGEKIGLTVSRVLQSPNLEDLDSTATDLHSAQNVETIQPFELLGEADDVDSLIAEVAAKSNVPVESIEDVYPCTPLQEALMALSIQQSGDYIARHTFHLPRSVDLFRLQKAWETAFQTLPILRTRIVQTYSHGLQQVVVKDNIEWSRGEDLATAFVAESNIPMGPGDILNRFGIIQEPGSHSSVLVWSSHHATYDGFSRPLVIELVEKIYHGIPADQIPRGDYRAFINHIRNTSADASRSFWTAQLGGGNPLSFPSIPSGLDRVNATAHLQHTIKARTESSLTSVIIRAAWAMVLAAYTSSSDVVFGVIVSGRNVPIAGIDRIPGPTIATVPIRLEIDTTEVTEAWLSRIQSQSIDMIPHENFGLQNIRRISDEIREASDFHSLLVIHPMREESQDVPALLKTGTSASLNMNTYPVVLEVQLNHGGCLVDISYDPSITSEAQMTRVIHQFDHVASQLSTDRPFKVGDIQVASPFDLEEVLKWNATIPQPAEECIHSLIAERVELIPDAQAVISWDGQMTYRELDESSSNFAQRILRRTTEANLFVPLCFEKSIWAVVAMLAVLKAGKALVLLDPSYPVERLRQIVSAVDAEVVISSAQQEAICSTLIKDIIVIGLVASDETNGSRVEPPNPFIDPSRSACVIFTSGSTGTPKGAVLSHRAYCSSALQHTQAISMDSTSRVLQFASYSFDASLLESLTTLIVGGCVCVPDEKYRNTDIRVEIKRMQANWALFTPSFASLLSPEDVPELKTLVLAGEAANSSLITKWRKHVTVPANAALKSIITGIFSTIHSNLHQSSSPMNLGRAVGGVCWVVDPNCVDRLAPIGAPGELLLEGPHIGDGYLNDQDKTKENFLEHRPTWFFRDLPSPARFYRTGDLVKYDSDGSIIFIGRKDNQVKIRGQRVEMEEIENLLATIPFVGHAMVMMPSAGQLRKRLVGVISVHKEAAFEGTQQSSELKIVSADLRESVQGLIDVAQRTLSAKLPRHMIPNIWVPVESVPVLASHKLDRKRIATWLHELDEHSWQRLGEFTVQSTAEEMTEMEKTLRLLWNTILNVEPSAINSRSSFLQLGGDSISAMQLMSRAREQGIRLTMLDIVKSTSLRELARLATRDLPRGQANGLQTESTDTPFELSPIQKLYFQVSPEGNNAFEQSMLLCITRKIPASTLSQALERIVQHHSALRTHYSEVTPGSWMQRIVGHPPSKNVLRIHHAPADAIPRIVSESKERIDFRNGPIFVGELIETGQEQFLFLAAHHLSIDLVSWRILLQDLEDLLLRRVEDLATSLSFQSWCSLLSEYCQQLDLRRFLLPIKPVDWMYWGMHEGINNTYAEVVRQGFVLENTTSALILRECNTAFTNTPLDIFLAAVITSFARVFPDRDIPSVLLEGHGREPWSPSIDILRTVGWLTTLYPVSLRKQDSIDIISAVRSVKDHRSKFLDNGLASFACRQYRQHSSFMSQPSVAEITLNYLGLYQQLERQDALFREAAIDLQEQDSSTQERFSLFNITVQLRDGQIHFDFSYNRASKNPVAISRWVTECAVCMREAAVILPKLHRRYTLGDFPLLQMSRAELQALLDDTLPALGIDIEAVDNIMPCSPVQLDILHYEEYVVGHHMTRLNFEVSAVNSHEIDVVQLEAAFAAVVQRHSILRTVFLPIKGLVFGFNQLVLKDFSPEIPCLVSDDFAFQPAYTETVYKKLHTGQPPYQVTFHHGASRNAVLITIDSSHAIIDGASMAIILRDWDLAYQKRLPLGAAPGYHHQIRLLQDRSSQAAITYWEDHLSGISPRLLPLGAGGCKTERQQKLMPLNLPTIQILQALCQEVSTTLSNLFHTIWSLALYLQTGSSDVCFGYLVSGRDVPIDGITEAVGPYFHLLISRYQIEPSHTLKSVLQMVQRTMTERLPFQNFSFPEMKQCISMPKEPVFNTLINIHRFASLNSGQESELQFTARKGYDPLAYDMELTGKIDDEIRLYLAYWSTSFSDGQALGMAALVEKILDTMLADLQMFTGDLKTRKAYRE